MRIFRFLLIILVSIINQSLATEKDNADLLEGVIKYQGNIFYYPATPNTLYLLGSIDGDPRASIELRRAIRDNNATKFVLASGGGSVDVGLEYASILRDKSISVYVPSEFGCLSSCASVFFGGTDRYAAGPVGVHQMWLDTNRKADINSIMQKTQATVSDIIAILNSFKVPPHIYEHMLRRVGNDFYLLNDQDLKMLDAVTPSDWHAKADEVLSEVVKNNNELIELAKFFNPDTTSTPPKSNTARSDDISEEEIARRIVAKIQALLNEHNCNAGVPDGIAGKKTEDATLRFAEATGYEFEDGPDTIIRFIEALENTKRPACGVTKPPKKETAKSEPIPNKGQSLVGDWAVLQRCKIGTSNRILRGQISLTNLVIKGGSTPTANYDAYYVTQNRDEFTGTVTEMLWRKDNEIYVTLSRTSNPADKIVIYGSDINTDRSAIKVRDADFEQGASNGKCTLDVYRVSYNAPPKSLDNNLIKSIKINVDGPAWVKVKDASNRLIFNKYAYRYLPAEVSGKTPLKISVDRADKVTSIQVNGREFGSVSIRNNTLSATVR